MLHILEIRTLSDSTATPTNGHLTYFRCSARYRSKETSEPSLLIGLAGVVWLVYCYNWVRDWFACISQSLSLLFWKLIQIPLQSSYCSSHISMSCVTTSGVLDTTTISYGLQWDSYWLTDYINRQITSACTYFHLWRSHSAWQLTIIVQLP